MHSLKEKGRAYFNKKDPNYSRFYPEVPRTGDKAVDKKSNKQAEKIRQRRFKAIRARWSTEGGQLYQMRYAKGEQAKAYEKVSSIYS